MVQEFKAEKLNNGEIVVKPIIERNSKGLFIHVPSLKLIKKLVKQENKKDGKRDIQQI